MQWSMNSVVFRVHSRMKMKKLTLSVWGVCFGSVSTGLMHATPGEIKSLRSFADKIADILSGDKYGEGLSQMVKEKATYV